jgi:hypothetical protein
MHNFGVPGFPDDGKDNCDRILYMCFSVFKLKVQSELLFLSLESVSDKELEPSVAVSSSRRLVYEASHLPHVASSRFSVGKACDAGCGGCFATRCHYQMTRSR